MLHTCTLCGMGYGEWGMKFQVVECMNFNHCSCNDHLVLCIMHLFALNHNISKKKGYIYFLSCYNIIVAEMIL